MPEAFGDYMKHARLAAGLSLRRVADQLGITAVYLSEMENGTRAPSRKYARWWAEIVGADPDVAERLAMPEEVRALHKRLARYRWLLDLVALMDPWEIDSGMYSCNFCTAEHDLNAEIADDESIHDMDCTWLLIRQAVLPLEAS